MHKQRDSGESFSLGNDRNQDTIDIVASTLVMKPVITGPYGTWCRKNPKVLNPNIPKVYMQCLLVKHSRK